MARRIEPSDAKLLLAEMFSFAEDDYREASVVDLPPDVMAATDRLFDSNTAAYREALIGCAVARVLDPQIDIRLPATEHGENAFSGRSLADNVITPFLRERTLPASASPYLSSLRGGAKFVTGGAPRIQRDKKGFAALVEIVDYLRQRDTISARDYLRYLLRRFVLLRENASVALKRIAKPNLEQLRQLIIGLLNVKSGGRFPAFLATAMFQTLTDCHQLEWNVEFQGINVADKASGAVGDITIRKDGEIILGVEVTERPIDQSRVTMTFNQKVSPQALSSPHFGYGEQSAEFAGL